MPAHVLENWRSPPLFLVGRWGEEGSRETGEGQEFLHPAGPSGPQSPLFDLITQSSFSS